jgi:hypothetical protein
MRDMPVLLPAPSTGKNAEICWQRYSLVLGVLLRLKITRQRHEFVSDPSHRTQLKIEQKCDAEVSR